MTHHWLLITFWFSPVSLQYISTGNIGNEPVLENPPSSLHFSLPYANFLIPPLQNTDLEIPSETLNDPFYTRTAQDDVQRKRRTADIKESHWYPNAEENEKTSYVSSDNSENNQRPFLASYRLITDENATNMILDPLDKKNFSPWGGKRDERSSLEKTWTWKRASSLREPSMPKRVRFSPWGGKRSGQMIFKPNSKSTRIIYASSLPELTRIVSNFSPASRTFKWAGLQFIPTQSLDKRNPIKVLALSAPLDGKILRDALPFKAFLDQMPLSYKPGHPYYDVNLKKDGKRKVKFSAWGGKRSPPIIGPIWTPTPQDIKESTLNSILLIRNHQDPSDSPKAL